MARENDTADMQRALLALIAHMAASGVRPSDSDEVRLHKATLSLTTGLISLAGLVWAGMYAALGFYRAAVIPLAYAVLSAITLPLAVATDRFDLFRAGQLSMMAILPFLLQWQLGGIARSGAVVVWSFWTPLYALLTGGARGWQGWLVVFLVLVAASGIAEHAAAAGAPPIPPVLSAIFFALNIGGLAMVTILLMRYVVRERDEAQQRSEQLLLNILPRPIAQRLKRDPGAIADAYADATVLFADLVDFTTLSAEMSAQKVVTLLNDVFSEFDRLAEQHHLEKIKTIGDAYMVVGGLPVPRADHADAVAEMALQMQEALDAYAVKAGMRLALRIGIHSGPVVAGVIGRQKFSYDLWGDTVNTASRMESHGVPGRIQATPDTYARLRDRYQFEERGRITVKGKGEMTTYFLVGHLPFGSLPRSSAV